MPSRQNNQKDIKMKRISIDWLGACGKCGSEAPHRVDTELGTAEYVANGDKVTCNNCGHTGETESDAGIGIVYWDELPARVVGQGEVWTGYNSLDEMNAVAWAKGSKPVPKQTTMKAQVALADQILKHVKTGRQFLAPAGTTLEQAHTVWETYASPRQKRTHLLHAAKVGDNQVLVRVTVNPEHARAVKKRHKDILHTAIAVGVLTAFYAVLHLTNLLDTGL